jgi:Cu2+-exporting ATPase
MSCCAPIDMTLAAHDPSGASDEELLLASRSIGEGIYQTDLSVPSVHCGACMQTIERALAALPGVLQARVNLSTRRVTVQWDSVGAPPPLVATLGSFGYPAHLDDPYGTRTDNGFGELVRALGVAGFAASNIMLLSVSVWSGADGPTRDLFHWFSALIALPALAYSGRVFFRSAWQALRHGRTNMDVPISIGVLLAFGLSLYETLHHGPHAYFDATISLLFFLLIGRTLDHMMRERARLAVKGLARLAARGALVQQKDGTRVYLPVNEIVPGTMILLAAGERVPVDARVASGRSELDCSLVTGESAPQPVGEEATLQAGTLNLTAPLTLVATASARESFLSEMIRMMETVEAGRSAHRRIADRAARLYAPAVHAIAILTFLGWMMASGDLHQSITIAIAVLIVTCPCALGLAVPMVQVVAARRLFERGMLLKDGGALERLAEVDSVMFDKTGTLTLGHPRLLNAGAIDPAALNVAAGIAAHSRHPFSRALATAAPGVMLPASAVSEHPGCGLEVRLGTATYRLGCADWALAPTLITGDGGALVLAKDGTCVAAFTFDDQLRQGARAAITELLAADLPVEILSGDRSAAVRRIAEALSIGYAAGLSPAQKAARVAAAAASGRKVLMVGDGLNDAPALVAAHASIAPGSAADIGRNAADLVFLHEPLGAVPEAIRIARAARRLIRQNLALAVGYNLVAVPIAVLGHVTPLIAAVAMSLSSVIVVGNALRLRGGRAASEEARPCPRGSVASNA